MLSVFANKSKSLGIPARKNVKTENLLTVFLLMLLNESIADFFKFRLWYVNVP